MSEEEADQSVYEIQWGKVSERGNYVWDCSSRKLRILSAEDHASQFVITHPEVQRRCRAAIGCVWVTWN